MTELTERNPSLQDWNSRKSDKLNLKCPITRRQCNQNDSSAIVVIGLSYWTLTDFFNKLFLVTVMLLNLYFLHYLHCSNWVKACGVISGVGEGAHRKPTLDGCFLVLNSLDFTLSVINAKISFVLSVMNENIKTIGLPSRIFSRFVFMREISTPEL